jgi:nicotinate-nucleotide adenylyltransferase
MQKRIGLLGGTFDPVHNGHIAIARSFISSTYIDELWVLLTPVPPHKQGVKQATYKQREQMLRLALIGLNKVKVTTIENDLPKPSYTIQTIRYLKKTYPENLFLFCLGEDSLAQFHTWKSFNTILEEVDLLVATRPDVDHSSVPKKILANTHFVDHSPVSTTNSESGYLVLNS